MGQYELSLRRKLITRSLIVAALLVPAVGMAVYANAVLGAVPVQDSLPQSKDQSTSLVISQIYGGGGNTGATFTNDFVEVFNPQSSPVTMTNWSVQYASATGSTWLVTALNGTIPPGGYFLVQLASGGAVGVPLPTPDASGTTNMSATAGKVALVSSSIALSGTCPTGGAIVDFVGYGTTANCFEGGGPAPYTAGNNTVSTLRNGGGCIDTDNNATDFSVITPPTPRNSNPANNNPCGGTPTPGSPTSTTNVPTLTATPSRTTTITPIPGLRIHDIQGAAHRSPYTGQSVNSIPAIVIARVSNGFYMQDPSPDADVATSEGILVFTGGAPTVNVGDSVTVSGTVTEFRPGGAGSANLSITELTSPVITVVSTGNPLPAPVVIGTGGRIPPTEIIEDQNCGDVELGGCTFDPASDGIDFYESMEGMHVQVNNPVAVSPRNNFGEITVLGDDGVNASVRTTRGGIIIRPTPVIYGDFNPERIILDDVITTTPQVNVGDHFTAPAVGVMDYSFGNFKLLITQPMGAVSGGLAQEQTTPQGPNQLAVGNFNVENLDPGDPPSKFTELANIIVNNLRSPDLLSVEEVQDNDGPTNSAEVSADVTWGMLITAIQNAGGPTYQFRQVNPVDDQDGGEPGGNIRQGFLYRTDRGLQFVDRPGGCSTCDTLVVSGGSGPELSFSPGRIMPTATAFASSRKPLAGEFTFNGHKLFVVGNHFNSKGGDHPLFGRFQYPVRSSEVQRHQQAQIVNNFVDAILALDTNANVIVLGDLNDFYFSTTINILEGDAPQADPPSDKPQGANVLNNLIETLPLPERYTYVFDGNSQDLDNTLISNNLLNITAPQFDVVHVNAEFAVNASDHDPQVTRFNLPAGASVTPTGTPLPCPTGTPVVIQDSIALSDPTQALRLFRDGIPDSCAKPGGPCATTGSGAYHYDVFTFTNSSPTEVCVTVDISTNCAGSNFIYSGAYVPSFNPASICDNWVADSGNSPNPSGSYSFTVPAGAQFQVNVHEVTNNAGCPAYTLTISGLASCPTPTATSTTAPTSTSTGTPTLTVTATNSPVPTATRTNTAVPPTSTQTSTAVPPTATSTNTALPPTTTSTATAVPPTVTGTNTAVAATATRTNTVLPSPTGTVCVQQVLLIPDWTNDRVMAFDAVTGNLINANFIPPDPAHLSSPKNAILSAAGNTILVSDQIEDVVQEYSLSGTWIRTFAPAGGPNPAILDNILGITLRQNGNLLVTVTGGTNQDSVAEFDSNGNYLGNFIAPGSGGIDGPFDIYLRTTVTGTDYLVPGINSDNILRYDLNGNFLGLFAPVNNFPQQLNFSRILGNTLNANFSGTQVGVLEFDYNGNQVGQYGPITGNRGVYELPNGNILTTDDTGVHEMNRAGQLISTKISGVNAQYIEAVGVSGSCATFTPAPTETPTSTRTVTATRTVTLTRTVTATRTSTPGACQMTEYKSSDVPKTIGPDAGTVTTSTLTIAGSGVLDKVEVMGIVISHTSPMDMDAYLISPQGTRVELFTDVCGGDPDWIFGNTYFSLNQNASSLIGTNCPPRGFQSSTHIFYRPEGDLNSLVGQNANGVWTLEITDDASGNGGLLFGWGLRISTGGACPTKTPSAPTPIPIQ